MTKIERLIANVNSVIFFLREFSDPNPKDVTFTWINDDDSTTDITYNNIKKFQDSVFGATGMDASGILDKLKTIDGSSSGLDADLLDGLHAEAFARVNGDVTRRFRVAEGREDYDAVNKKQLEGLLGTIGVTEVTLDDAGFINDTPFGNEVPVLDLAVASGAEDLGLID